MITIKQTTQSIVPSTLEYTAATGIQILTVLSSAATLVPVPLLQEAIKVALNVLEACEVHQLLS